MKTYLVELRQKSEPERPPMFQFVDAENKQNAARDGIIFVARCYFIPKYDIEVTRIGRVEKREFKTSTKPVPEPVRKEFDRRALIEFLNNEIEFYKILEENCRNIGDSIREKVFRARIAQTKDIKGFLEVEQ